MTQNDATHVFNIVKNDDLASFCMLVEKNKDIMKICFGRFPLLTACYLFNSKKIIKKYQKKLQNVSDFDAVFEPFELYIQFKKKSGKSLRYYAGKDDLVMPIEVMAILGKDHFVKKHFKQFSKSSTTEQKLKNIYLSKEQKCEIKQQNIKISAKKLTKKRLKALIISNSAVFGALAIVAICLFVVANTIGLGTSFSPRKVYATNDFVAMLSKNKSVSLQNDLIFENKFCISNFGGTIFGNGKTIIINYEYSSCLFENFSGMIEDLKIINNDEQIETEKNLSLFANVNGGTIKNVEITFESTIKIQSTNDETFFAGFAITNNNTISNCKVMLDIDISSENNSDCFASGIAGKNNGTISACEMLENSKINAKNVDICGIASQNFQNAEISSSKNNSTLFQTTDMASWSPNVAGICITNLGTISNCYNYGKLQAEKMIETSNNAIILVGGICSTNQNLISHCKNKNDIVVDDKNSTIYVGGIAGYSYSQLQGKVAKIEGSGTETYFDIKKEDGSAYCICGGIAGFMSGYAVNQTGFAEVALISNCFSICDFSVENSRETNVNTALLVGASDGQVFFGLSINISFEKVYCLANEKTTKVLSIASVGTSSYYIDEITGADISICESESEIKSSDVYWD